MKIIAMIKASLIVILFAAVSASTFSVEDTNEVKKYIDLLNLHQKKQIPFIA